MKKFKIVFVKQKYQYQLWVTNHIGKFVMRTSYDAFTKKGEMINDMILINDNILWDIDKYTELGYKFVGIEFLKK